MTESFETKPKHKKRRWLKWTAIVVGALLIIGISILIYIYSYLKSISIEDIAARHEIEGQENIPHETPKIPVIIKKPVEKASDLIGGEDIETQDAVDVAAILLNSGLSFKEISYLQGNANYDLSNEEKQKIRDLLLSKLSAEEIELLRSITVKYGKSLHILNPDYPIEWVGERDPEKIKLIEAQWAEMLKEKKNPNANTGSNNSGTPSPKPGDTNVKTPEVDEDNKNEEPVKITDEQKKAKQKIDAKYESQMSDLSASCKTKSATLMNQIVAELKSNKDASLETIQSNFLTKVLEAEAECDAKFSSILANAKSDYKKESINEKEMPNWSASYEKAKADARSAAMGSIAAALTS
ncbi:hypothetical protein [Paenibacillus sp. NPDC057967]|uniref:hypothetical protein n=1 Tax=Paenibacillus sp. NPDC057967 TaxID=3346293 RepID=UPI0036D8A7F3